MADKNGPIGVFDSGVGGLTVVRKILESLPGEEIIYFGDNLRAPYGGREPQVLAAFSREIMDFLLGQGVKAIVVACGTISARIFNQVVAMTDLPIVGMVNPAVEAALDATINGRIGVAATAGTISSCAHERAIKAGKTDAAVFGVACPLFVPLVEEGWLNNQVADLVAETYLSGLKDKGIDTILLGCTHYPLLLDSIKKAVGNEVIVVDPAVRLAADFREKLAALGLLRNRDEPPKHRLYVSGDKEKFDKIATLVLGSNFAAEVLDASDTRDCALRV